MKIIYTKVFVNDQDKALKFYTQILGFVKKSDIGAGDYRWLTVVSPEDQNGTELILERNNNPAAKNVIKKAIAEKNLVVLHVHSTENVTDRGRAIIDIFRVENGKIVEHWDVIQNIPEQSKNSNTMF